MSAPEEPTGGDSFPVAEVKPTNAFTSGRIFASKLWWITLVCLLVASYLAWQAHRPTGLEITIDFPEGHGLKAGDALRHRGIDVGVVSEIELAPDLHGVRATVMLEQSATAIANEKSEFWIVRPLLSLTNISGLETAVGAKYIAVHPGPSQSGRTRSFQGRKTPPAVTIDEDGTEIVLLGEESYGISAGSPVTYRGIRVGQIHKVDLAKQARQVAIYARVDEAYSGLLRRGSKFWKTSGVDVDFGLKGFHLSTESLEAIARGGVSFLTPEGDENEMQFVQSGHEFELAAKMEKEWEREAASFDWK